MAYTIVLSNTSVNPRLNGGDSKLHFTHFCMLPNLLEYTFWDTRYMEVHGV